MKYFNFIIVCLIGQFSMTACSNEEEIPDNIKSIVFDSRENVTEIDLDKILNTHPGRARAYGFFRHNSRPD